MTFNAHLYGWFPICLYSPTNLLWASYREIGSNPMHETAGMFQTIFIIVQGEYDCHYDQIANIINYSNLAQSRSIQTLLLIYYYIAKAWICKSFCIWVVPKILFFRWGEVRFPQWTSTGRSTLEFQLILHYRSHSYITCLDNPQWIY